MASRDRQPPTTKQNKKDLTIYPKARGGLIWQGKGVSGIKALVLLFFHRLGASSSTTALGLLGAFFSEAWLRGLPLCHFGTWSRFRSRDGYVAAASSYGFATNNSSLPIFHDP
ncbi:hypothetical protein F8M41_017418 [Gigaspora margarita]|uniref:Uncharacterized protein n=1 Tax=Gigaspora margarita TaxID=4874 RepID=A0A8H4B5J6_GIGMA|nr:hypothetical protein F8M41_017418 [Gigaspora margarita]